MRLKSTDLRIKLVYMHKLPRSIYLLIPYAIEKYAQIKKSRNFRLAVAIYGIV